MYTLAEEVQPNTYAILEPEVGTEDYIEFKIPEDGSNVYDSFSKQNENKDDDHPDLYDTFRSLVETHEQMVDDGNQEDNHSEDVFMSHYQLQAPTELDVDDASTAVESGSGRHVEHEDLFMSLSEVMGSPLSQAQKSESKSKHYNNQPLDSDVNIKLPVSKSSKSHPLYQNTKGNDNKVKLYPEMKSNAKSKHDYYNIRIPENDDDEETFMSIEELKVSVESQDRSKSPHYLYEPQNETCSNVDVSATDMYDHSNQKAAMPSPSGYDRVYFAAGSQPLTTIEDWLRHVDMLKYKHNFLDNGWESLIFLPEITVADLASIGVSDAEHQCIILQSIKALNVG